MDPLPSEQSSSSNKNRMIIFSLIIVLAVVVGGGVYLYFAENAKISSLTSDLTSANQQADALKADLTSENQKVDSLTNDLQTANQKITALNLKVAELTCKGRWVNNVCIPFSLALSAKPISGQSPLDVKFTAKVPDTNYGIDFGDGSSSWITGGSSAESGGSCIQNKSGVCTITISHTYTASLPSSKFTAKLTQNGTTVSTIIISVTQ